MRSSLISFAALCAAPGLLAQRPTLAPAVRAFVQVDTSVVALTHVRVIDGTGARRACGSNRRHSRRPHRRDRRRRRSTSVAGRRAGDGPLGEVGDPGARHGPRASLLSDRTGRVRVSRPRASRACISAGGVTSMRSGGNMNGFGEINVKRSIDRGERAGPWIDATAPYLEGPGLRPAAGARADRRRRRATPRRLLDRHGRHVAQGVHAHHARRAQGGDRRGTQARHEDRPVISAPSRIAKPRSWGSTTSSTASSRPPISSPTRSPTSAPDRASVRRRSPPSTRRARRSSRSSPSW